ncbi:hypothetical protein CC1G_10142 [Coprinopsis cinerea okayama7|uniref:Uncharacterized protein n=1 Tax=Coprinopsis cinerea (strain Okayama-7 / 130 / ATCC MYA-4618 / FGSC 9003) TaxID=240176 RepID=A8PED0_COPC7|nr:hypothetical protein CC1G_10142 [Coprinopsis cinerea okayama7\|eukprot:XP_001840768.2 hypothetical protein CC1G_10142 [Coprinopsis cinerea okayama7\
MSTRTTRSSAKKPEQGSASGASSQGSQQTSSPKTRKRNREETDSPTPNKKAKVPASPNCKDPKSQVLIVNSDEDDAEGDEDDTPLSQLQLQKDKGKAKEVELKKEQLPKDQPAENSPDEEEGDFEDPFNQLNPGDSNTDMYEGYTVDTSSLPEKCPMLLDEVRDPFLTRRNLYNGVKPVREGSLKTWKTTGDDPTPLMSVGAWQKILPKNLNLDGEYYNPSFADVTEFVVRSIVIYRFSFTRYELHRPKIGIVAGVSVIGVVESKLRAHVDTRFVSGIMNRGHWERWNGFFATVFNHDNLQAQVVGTKIQFQTKSRFEGGNSESRADNHDNPFSDIQDKSYKSPVKQRNSVRRMAPYNYDEEGTPISILIPTSLD